MAGISQDGLTSFGRYTAVSLGSHVGWITLPHRCFGCLRKPGGTANGSRQVI
ncbi:MAG: hypothetical protein ACK5EA_19415 [Planctomycetaceae bacterium]